MCAHLYVLCSCMHTRMHSSWSLLWTCLQVLCACVSSRGFCLRVSLPLGRGEVSPSSSFLKHLPGGSCLINTIASILIACNPLESAVSQYFTCLSKASSICSLGEFSHPPLNFQLLLYSQRTEGHEEVICSSHIAVTSQRTCFPKWVTPPTIGDTLRQSGTQLQM